ncbi:MAG: ATP-binding protein [Chloroflexota bacterium]
MTIELWGLEGTFYLGLPPRPTGLAAAALYSLLPLTLLALRLARGRPRRRTPLAWGSFAVLLASAPLAAQVLLVRLQAGPGSVSPTAEATFSVFGALPWMLAAGLVGETPAMLVALAGGLARAGWETHSLLTPLQIGLVAAAGAWMIRRDYTEWPARLARHPAFTGLAAGGLLAALRTVEVYAYSAGSFYDGLDFTLSHFESGAMSALLEVGLAGLIAEYVRWRSEARWYRPAALVAGPYGRSLTARLLIAFSALGLAAGVGLVYGDWVLARSYARELIESQMVRTARQAGEGIPYFIETGRALAGELAEEVAPAVERGGLTPEALAPALRRLPYFSFLCVYNRDRLLLASVPESELPLEPDSLDYEGAMLAALQGVPQEVVVNAPLPGGATYMVFLWPVLSPQSGAPVGALAGWSDLVSNPILQPVLQTLASVSEGEAFITDDRGMVLYHPLTSQVGQVYHLNAASSEGAVSEQAPDGTFRLVVASDVEGYPWRVVVTSPQRVVENLALRLATRLVGVLLVIGAALGLVVYLTSRRLTQPLRWMAAAAETMARGSLSQPVSFVGEDEIGRLASSFERMRRSLKARLEEMDLLLTASQRVAASFELQEVLPPILSGVQGLTGADAVRLVLEARSAPTIPQAFGAGEAPPSWQGLDTQVLDLCRRRGRFILENPGRARAVLDFQALETPLEALIALPLQDEEEFIGTLWLGYRQPHAFAVDEVNLLSILAGQLGVSVANARLYLVAEQERLRLAAILAATPEAVIVTDRQGRISLANPAAEVVLRGRAESVVGQPAGDWFTSPDLLRLLTRGGIERRTAEVTLDDGRVLFAEVSDVEAAGVGSAGRLCVLRDVTHYKKLDALKSEFVATVSHDLRAPLTLMRGYATMLSMVGSLTDKQREFLGKILSSIDSMAHLVDNVLDLGRIEAGVGLKLEAVDVAAVIRDVVGAYRPQAVNKQIGLEVELADGMRPIEADAMLLRQAVANLVDNAVKFTQPGGRVKVRARQEAGKQQLSVEDSGIGIAPADQARLFEKFYRAGRPEAVRERGPGLGLAIVKSIAEQHRGRVAVESRLGAGSRFTLELPLRQENRGTAEPVVGQ